MKESVISRLDVIRRTKTMMGIAIVYSLITFACLVGIVVKTPIFVEIVLVLAAFFLLLHYRRMLSYFKDIVMLRIRVFEGNVRKLVYGIDYEGKVCPVDYDIYELVLNDGEKLRFPCEHKIFNISRDSRARFFFLESTLDIVKAELISN